jgi:hypothetical protein
VATAVLGISLIGERATRRLFLFDLFDLIDLIDLTCAN